MSETYLFPGWWRRLASLLYELLLITAVLLGASAAYTPLITWLGHSPLLDLGQQLWQVLLLFGYFGYAWTRSGQTVAMKTWRLKLIGAHGAPLDWPRAALRYLIALALFAGMPLIAYKGLAVELGAGKHALTAALLWWIVPLGFAYFDPEKQFLHDRLAGTRLVRVKPAR
ncbi:RDD family protein [Crenobacter sp. SG2305]|uniref:RDD family protein n=1 Tax=Crenobacter oryzisoli TaxID=3056844 RepID=UPI0025AB249F|nr:RDD family protein [Crenobacter sp. SG2305]MDN0084289.1 RDD family protein [Crenobacter sp. SG2305]